MASSRKTERREVEVSQVEITAFCHATEDCTRVEYSIRNLLPPELRDVLRLNATTHEGYYGNPIRVYTLRVQNKNHVNAILKYLSTSMNPTEKSIIRATLGLRYDSATGRLVIRFSKQDLYMGSLRIADTDDIVKLTIFLRNVKGKSDVENYLRALELI